MFPLLCGPEARVPRSAPRLIRHWNDYTPVMTLPLLCGPEARVPRSVSCLIRNRNDYTPVTTLPLCKRSIHHLAHTHVDLLHTARAGRIDQLPIHGKRRSARDTQRIAGCLCLIDRITEAVAGVATLEGSSIETDLPRIGDELRLRIGLTAPLRDSRASPSSYPPPVHLHNARRLQPARR